MGNMSREGNSADGDLSESPSGESPAQGQETNNNTGEGTDDSAQEPGFGDSAGNGESGIPDLSDEPSLEDAMASFEDTMGEGEDSGRAENTGSTSSAGATGPLGGISPGSAGSLPNGSIPGIFGTVTPGSGSSGSGGYRSGDSSSGGYGSGPLTPAEQVAILDAQLERGAGEFDSMILEEHTKQRNSTRDRASTAPPSQASSGSQGGSSSGAYDEGGIANAPGGGDGAYGGGGAGIPQNTAKYPPPGDIPSGTDDDVVARQLREAAMREPDPALREKLWDEYRNYKGIN